MPPDLALLLWLILLLGLLRWDPARDAGTSLALWIPVIWVFTVGSRLPSQWLGTSYGSGIQALEEGNPLDRVIFSALMLLAIGILISRSFKWGNFVSRNLALILLVSFALVSVVWSDFPLVSLKRWFRDLGNYLVILVILSDPRPIKALSTVLRRVCYLLIPLSILLIKYYPQIGMQYSFWTGDAMFVGATTSKNMLGVACLVSGIFFFWDTVTHWSNRKEPRTKRIIMINFAFIGMTLWLLNHANSATSSVCLAIGCAVILAAHSRSFKLHPTFLKAVIPTCCCIYGILAYGFDFNGDLAGVIGRDPTLTGRTNIWRAVLSTNTNPIIGTGYESFWLGPRLNQVWQVAGHVNEAHNGYLEVYLNLGLIGMFLLFVFLIAGYVAICKRLSSPFAPASLGLSFWTIMIFYNVTESAAFNGQFLWVIFLLVIIIISTHAPIAHDLPAVKNHLSQESPLELQETVASGDRISRKANGAPTRWGQPVTVGWRGRVI
jgi:exopolysaccharide production protein ExoQ